MKSIKYLIFPILALLCSCEDAANDYRYPSVVTDFASLIIDAEGQPEQLSLDNGHTYPMSFTEEYRESHSSQLAYRPDTVYRVISIYELRADSVAYVYSIGKVESIVPSPLRKGEELLRDPSYLQSCWLSGGYLNMVIELKALNGMHRIGFVDTTPESMQGKEFTFYHDANGDIESYRRKLYASIPLAPFTGVLQQGDTLRFVINTYDEGLIQREFVL